MIIPDRMVHILDVPLVGTLTPLIVHRDYDTVMLASLARLDLDGIGQLQVALDQAVTDIREYQARKAADDD